MWAIRMALREWLICMGGSGRLKTSINARFANPRGPTRALNAAATTRVGKTKGMPARAWMSDFPRNSWRAKRYAPGSPINKVNKVETAACQKVNQITPRNPGVANAWKNGLAAPSRARAKLRRKILVRG